jgi:hypothetical protein
VVNVLYLDAGVDLEILFGFGGKGFKEGKKLMGLVELREVLYILDGKEEHFHHFLELIILEVVIVIFYVIY